MKKPKGTTTVAEAGRMGGVTTRETHGRAHMAAIGKKGGAVKMSQKKSKPKGA